MALDLNVARESGRDLNELLYELDGFGVALHVYVCGELQVCTCIL